MRDSIAGWLMTFSPRRSIIITYYVTLIFCFSIWGVWICDILIWSNNENHPNRTFTIYPKSPHNSKKRSRERLYNISDIMTYQGNYKECHKMWENTREAYERTKALAKENDDANYFQYFGSALHLGLGELTEAENIYQEGLDFDPKHIGILTSLVDLYLERKDENADEEPSAHWKARELYNKVKDLLGDKLKKVDDGSTLHKMGKLHLVMEEYDEAKTYLLKAFEKDGESADICGDLGIVYSKDASGKDDSKKAIKYFQKALKRDPDDLTTRNNLAEAFFKAELIEKAEREYKKIFRITPNHVESHIGLGEIYTFMGDAGDQVMYDEAVSQFDEGLKIAKSENRSKKLNKKELAAVLYSRGHTRVKLHESHRIRRDESLLHHALDDFNECFRNDPDHHKSKWAAKKIKERLSYLSPQGLVEKIGTFVISFASLSIFILTQVSFIFGIPRTLEISYYSLLTFGSLIFLVAGLSLPQLSKLRVAGIELEKSPVEQITTPGVMGISK